MDYLLNAPITEKKCEVGQNEHFEWSTCSMQGWRPTMEDAHICQDVFDN